MTVQPIPTGFHTITPHLSLDDAAAAIDFYKRAFAAEVTEHALDPSGKKVFHSALRIGDSMIFVNDVFPEMGAEASKSSMWLYLTDVDASFKRAVDAGATPAMPPVDCFWGDRMGIIVDPFGQKWTLAMRQKNLTPEEMKQAEAAFFASMKK